MHPQKIRVLIIDDSAIVRKILSETLMGESDIEIVGTAADAYIGKEKMSSLKPDVVTLDIEMPGMDGLTFLKQMMHRNPVPTIIISSLGKASCAATLEALRCGAVDVIAKPAGPYSVGDLGRGSLHEFAEPRARTPAWPPATRHTRIVPYTVHIAPADTPNYRRHRRIHRRHGRNSGHPA